MTATSFLRSEAGEIARAAQLNRLLPLRECRKVPLSPYGQVVLFCPQRLSPRGGVEHANRGEDQLSIWSHRANAQSVVVIDCG